MSLLTYELEIISKTEDYSQFIEQSTGLYYKLYNNPELLVDPSFKLEQLKKFNLLDVSIYDCIKDDVLTKLKQHETDIKKKKQEIEEIGELIEADDFKNKYIKFKLTKKYYRLKRNIDKDICFGGKALLRNITRLQQKLQQQKLKPEEIVETEELVVKYKKEFTDGRILGFYFTGRACEKGNRKFDFNLINNEVTFKPNKKFKSTIIFKCNKKRKKTLERLQILANHKEIPITVRLTNTHLYITFDNQELAGFAFNKKEYLREIKGVKDAQVKKDIAKKHCQEQESRMLKGKVGYRHMAVDLNPYQIGVVIVDSKTTELLNKIEKKDIVFKEFYELKGLNEKLGLKSSDKKQIRQNNKRKYELHEVWISIFDIAKHYGVAKFCVEDLDIDNSDKSKGKEFNRKVNNLWHRTLTNELIKKHTDELGIKLIPVEPCYSSFIGNLIYDDYDCIAAALEICRRGIDKYKPGNSLYPALASIRQERLNHLPIENVAESWIKLYNDPTLSELRDRNKSLKGLKTLNFRSRRSKVQIYKYELMDTIANI